MLEAERKRQDNIVEYVLYMFHTEEVIRSCQLSLEVIQKTVVEHTEGSKKEKAELMDWYKGLVAEMERENIEERGHLTEVLEVVGELSYVHKALVNVYLDKDYIKLWETAYPNLVELERKTNGAVRNPIELCFNGMYGVLVLKMKKQKINPETVKAVKTFSDLLAHLGQVYNDIRNGRLRFPETMQN